MLGGVLRVGENERSRTVVNARSVARRYRTVALERPKLRHRFEARIGAHRFVAVDHGVRMLAGDERRVRGVIQRELLRGFVLPDPARRSDRCGNAHAPLSRQLIDDDLVFRFACDSNRNDLVVEVSGRVRGGRAAVALIRKAYLALRA